MQSGAQPRGPVVKVKRELTDSQSIRCPDLLPLPVSWPMEDEATSTTTTTTTTSKKKFSHKMTNGFRFGGREDKDDDDDEEKEDEEEKDQNYQQDSDHNKAKAKQRRNRKEQKRLTNDLSPLSKLVIRCLLFITMLSGVGCVVVYQVRFIATKSGRTDYVLAGESVELSCHYMMKDEAEDIKQLVWSKDGKNFLRWRKNRPGLEVLSYTFKGHVDPTSVHSHLIIHNATIDMHGKYKCSIKTDLGTHEGEHDLVVISHGQCRLNDWRITSEQLKCRELFRLDCRQMFPRPVPSCGLWNDKLDKFIRSVTVDISEEVSAGQVASTSSPLVGSNPALPAAGKLSTQTGPPQTYRVKYSDKFELTLSNGSVNPLHADLLQYAGHLIFKCDILVPDTSWKLSLRHKMFDFADGCNSDPLDTIERMRANFSQLARMRLHKQQHYQRPLDDIEMLTSNLKYEILPPPQTAPGRSSSKSDKNDPNSIETSYQMLASVGGNSTSTSNTRLSSKSSKDKSQQQKDNMLTAGGNLNCWQRPRVGSIARLSCVPAPNQSRNQIKLSGTNLLQCRPNGHWVPINPRSVSSSIVVSNEVIDPRRAKQVLKKTLTVGAPSGPRRSTRRLQDANVSPASNESQSESLVTSTQVATNLLTNEADHTNEDDNDDDDSGYSSPVTHSSSGNHSNHLIELEIGPPLRPAGSGSSRSVGKDDNHGARDDASHDEISHNFVDNDDISMDLTPGELASLLPSCVLINPHPQHQNGRRSGNQRHHLASSSPNDRLPLLDDEGSTLESSYRITNHNRHGQHKGTSHDDESKWYTFFSSSSASELRPSKLNQRSHYISFIIVLSSTTAMLMHVTRILRT